MRTRQLSLLASLTLLGSALSACSEDAETKVPTFSAFESDDPNADPTGGDNKGAQSASEDSSTDLAMDPTGESATRAIEEADIVKVEGARLYALSQYGGLSIIDASNPDELRLLGRKKVQAQPFEMYVRDGVVMALYNSYGQYVEEADGNWQWVTSSHVIAFDTADPSHPDIVGHFTIPGTVSDSRIVGDILYVVGYESGWCWECSESPTTTVLALDLKEPTTIRQADRLSFEEQSNTYGWNRSISVNDQRMYVAGPAYGDSGPVGSTIQVIDISSPTGKMSLGTVVQAQGQIDSRWQMDEYEGILRVISQPATWQSGDPPRVQTFQVNGASDITPLASVDMTIPADEALRSVRFDGPRGYAITAVQTDPLFTLDLSDPTAPMQTGELVMPGWVYYMEPRGDRLLGLGYDNGNAEGALAVSLFDVSDLDSPTLLDRVNFGGDWSWIAEDQDRVQKAFKVLDESELITTPFSGWSETDADGCGSTYQSGVQLIDWRDDDLVLRGILPTTGEAKRALPILDRMLTVSEQRVETFDITDRDAPRKTDQVPLATIVQQTIAVGDVVVRVSADWWTSVARLETTTLAEVEAPEPIGSVAIQLDPATHCDSYTYLLGVAADETRVYAVFEHYQYDSGSREDSITTQVVTVDVSDVMDPRVIGTAELDFPTGYGGWYGGGMVDMGRPFVAVGGTLSFTEPKTEYDDSGNRISTALLVHVVDLADPERPSLATMTLPSDAIASTGLFQSGHTVALGHYAASPYTEGKVQFFVDRIDVTEPQAPTLLPKVNVPGALVAIDEETNRVATVDYAEVTKEGITNAECTTQFSSSWFVLPDNTEYTETALGTCHSSQSTVNLLEIADGMARRLGQHSWPVGETISGVAVGDNRLFLSSGDSYHGYVYAAVDCVGDCGGAYFTPREFPLDIVEGLQGGDFAVGTLLLDGGDSWGNRAMAASGSRVLLSTGWRGELVVVDGSTATSPRVVRQEALFGYVDHLTTIGAVGVASLGADGVQSIPMGD